MTKLLKKWLEALRSGEYEQAQYKLHDGHASYCCLGVLCKVDGYLDEVPGGFLDPEDEDEIVFEEYVPMKVWKRTGLDRELQSYVSCLNDTEGKTFDEIADEIEERAPTTKENDAC